MSNHHSHSPSYHVRSPTPSEEWAADADHQSPGPPHDDPEPPCIRPRDTLIEEWAADIADAQEEETTLSPVPNMWGGPADRPYACPWCPRTFTRQNYWKAHLETHDDVGGQKMYPCPHCMRTFNRRHNRDLHARTHNYDESHRFKCGVCEKRFTRKHDLQRHHQTYHTGTRAPAKFPFVMVASPSKPSSSRLAPVTPNPRTFPVATSSTRGPSRAPHEGSSDEAEASFKPRREVVKPSALGKYAFCQHFSPGVAHNGGPCDCFAR
jgi:uncharacterized Zn-finger protein